MSLTDALLLDPYKTDVWIAYRTEGMKSEVVASVKTELQGILDEIVAE